MDYRNRWREHEERMSETRHSQNFYVIDVRAEEIKKKFGGRLKLEQVHHLNAEMYVTMIIYHFNMCKRSHYFL